MALEDALNALMSDANREIKSSVGDSLRQRAARDDWRESVILQQLESGRNLARGISGPRDSAGESSDCPQSGRAPRSTRPLMIS